MSHLDPVCAEALCLVRAALRLLEATDSTPQRLQLEAALDQACNLSAMGKKWKVGARPPKGKDGRNWQLRYAPPPGQGRPGKPGIPYQRSAGTEDEDEALALAHSEEARLNGTTLPLGDVLDKYLDYRASLEGANELTIETYRGRAKNITRLHAGAPVDRASILRLQDKLAGEKSARSTNQHLILARAAWDWAQDRDLIRDGWPRGIKKLEEVETDLRPCTPRETFDLLAAAREVAGGRFYALLVFMADVGSRVTETTKLRERDLDRERCEVRFTHTKRKRSRTACVSPEVLELIPMSEDLDAPLWAHASDPSKPLHRHSVYNAFRRCLEISGLEGEPLSPHSLRRSYITDSLGEGVGMAQSMLQTGHTTTAVHLGYRKNAPNQAQHDAHERARARRLLLPHASPQGCGGHVLQVPHDAANGAIPPLLQGGAEVTRSG